MLGQREQTPVNPHVNGRPADMAGADTDLPNQEMPPLARPAARGTPSPVELAVLRERRSGYMTGIAELKREQENIEARLAEIKLGVLRTEGAVAILDDLIKQIGQAGPGG